MVSNLLLFGIPSLLVLYGIRKYRESKWGKCTNNIRLDNKLVLITGANSGIGYETAVQLGLRGADIIFGCRNLNLAITAIDELRKKINNQSNKFEFIELDLSSFESIRSFAAIVKSHHNKIDILINNAGVSMSPKQKLLTKDNLEIHMGINYFGHFLLTKLLEDLLVSDGENKSRVINVSSLLHQKGKINLDDLNYEHSSAVNPYSDSKLAMAYFGRELGKRTGLNVYNLCPGWVYTNLFRHYMKNLLKMILVLPIAFFFMRSKYHGAQTVVYCATEPSLANETGLFYRDCNQFKSKHNFDDKVGEKLWEISEKVVGLNAA